MNEYEKKLHRHPSDVVEKKKGEREAGKTRLDEQLWRSSDTPKSTCTKQLTGLPFRTGNDPPLNSKMTQCKAAKPIEIYAIIKRPECC